MECDIPIVISNAEERDNFVTTATNQLNVTKFTGGCGTLTYSLFEGHASSLSVTE